MANKTSFIDYAHASETVRTAAERAAAEGLTLGKYADSTEDAREGLTADEAVEIAREDASLLYVLRPSCEAALFESDLVCGRGALEGFTRCPGQTSTERAVAESDARFETGRARYARPLGTNVRDDHRGWTYGSLRGF